VGLAWNRFDGSEWAACLWLPLIMFAMQTVLAEELKNPPICSVETFANVVELPELAGICEVTPLPDGGNKVKINLTSNMGPVQVGGYTITTEHYNSSYLTPVVEAKPGDTVAARLVNWLPRRRPMVHGDGDENPTNLHYFHGGIVTPRNARDLGDAAGDRANLGDNVYLHLEASRELQNQSTAEFNVPIPGPGELDARVLEEEGQIAHPAGLGWYHSHLHGISSDQVMGGMSGLLSVGDAKENVKAACHEDAVDPGKCSKATSDLRERTDVRYVLLRDMPLRNISAHPQHAIGGTAEWAPQDRDFPRGQLGRRCGVFKPDGSDFNDQDARLREGFCQRSENSAWLFTLNGQRFPTITVQAGYNILLRIGNVSSNLSYWLELYRKSDGKPKDLTILSIDGVVPARPRPPSDSSAPAPALEVPELLLMAASRAEIFISNSEKHDEDQVYVLRTKELDMGGDHWPEIQLARIVLKANPTAKPLALALNAPVAFPITEGPFAALMKLPRPIGCVADLDPGKNEHRRVTFRQHPQERGKFTILTEIVHPSGTTPEKEEKFNADPEKTVGIPNRDSSGNITSWEGIPFEDYVLEKGGIDWAGTVKGHKHQCVELRPGKGSHKQLWVLKNETGDVHNFHIHQIKFRLATKKDLEKHKIIPPEKSHTCAAPTTSEPCKSDPACGDPGYKFYEDGCDTIDPDKRPLWHDTIPVPRGEEPVFLIMSFDAAQQIGRFVYHCHILKHEDMGLMAPIEVWDPYGFLSPDP
jgi:FtsP/CotA-like multicopper oxidase with cupredoxin domain